MYLGSHHLIKIVLFILVTDSRVAPANFSAGALARTVRGNRTWTIRPYGSSANTTHGESQRFTYTFGWGSG
jgi:hypothetical protein